MRRLAGLAATLLIVGLLVVAQFALPGIAAQQLRDRLARSGQVLSVQVSAFPAFELLWHQADEVTVKLGRYRSSSRRLASLLNEAGGVGSLTASARELDTGLLRLRDASLTKRGDQLTGSARVTEADLQAALPILRSVTPVASAGSPAGLLTLRGTASLLGVTASVDATLHESGGTLLVTPDLPLGGLATVQVFADPRLAVQSVTATPFAGGFAVRATGQLH